MTADQPSRDAATPDEQEKPRSLFVAAANVVRQINLVAIEFASCSAQRQDASLRPDMGLNAATSFLRPTVNLKDSGFTLRTSLLFRAGYNDEAGSQPIGVVRATIETEYAFKEDAPNFSEEDLNDFALCYGPFHVWGYWREFVQSSLARLNLPQMTVPLFLIAQAPTMVQTSLE